MDDRPDGEPGALIALDGTLNFRDLGGWPTERGDRRVRRGEFFRSDRLSDLSPADHDVLTTLGIEAVVDLRYSAEVAEHPSRLWTSVTTHHEIPMGGEYANQQPFIERALAGDYDGISDGAVGDSYIEFLTNYGPSFGRAVEVLLDAGPGLFHCTAGKDRTGLLAMLILRTVEVAEADVLSDFVLSNKYRAAIRVEQLRAVFEQNGLDVEDFRPALSAPRPALEQAMAWLATSHGTAEDYLEGPGGLTNVGPRLRDRLLVPAR